MSNWLVGRDTILDASALVGVLVRGDQWHQSATTAWVDLAGRCVTTEAALTEATHLVARSGRPHTAPLRFVIDVEIPVFAVHLMLHHDCIHLMDRYSNIPMDYADATLVALASRLHLRRVFTFDRKGFGAYRTTTGVPLELVPAA